jgi:hypothetical protein
MDPSERHEQSTHIVAQFAVDYAEALEIDDPLIDDMNWASAVQALQVGTVAMDFSFNFLRASMRASHRAYGWTAPIMWFLVRSVGTFFASGVWGVKHQKKAITTILTRPDNALSMRCRAVLRTAIDAGIVRCPLTQAEAPTSTVHPVLRTFELRHGMAAREEHSVHAQIVHELENVLPETMQAARQWRCIKARLMIWDI